MKIAFLYSGQGSQFPYMYDEFYKKEKNFSQIIDYLDSNLDFSIINYGLEIDSEDIYKTRIAQPLIVAYQIAMTHLLESKGIFPDIVAGMSVGQFSALEAAGVLEADDVLKIINERGKLMELDSKKKDTEMMALFGNIEYIKKTIAESIYHSSIFVSNVNSKNQIVVGGLKGDIEKFYDWCRRNTEIRSVILKNEGAFHTQYFEESSKKFYDFLENFQFKNANIPVVDNETGNFKKSYTPLNISTHMINRVNWKKDVENILKFGVDLIIEIGPGNQLLRLMKNVEFDGVQISIAHSEDLEKLKGIL